jgi:hypothetical protein
MDLSSHYLPNCTRKISIVFLVTIHIDKLTFSILALHQNSSAQDLLRKQKNLSNSSLKVGLSELLKRLPFARRSRYNTDSDAETF